MAEDKSREENRKEDYGRSSDRNKPGEKGRKGGSVWENIKERVKDVTDRVT